MDDRGPNDATCRLGAKVCFFIVIHFFTYIFICIQVYSCYRDYDKLLLHTIHGLCPTTTHKRPMQANKDPRWADTGQQRMMRVNAGWRVPTIEWWRVVWAPSLRYVFFYCYLFFYLHLYVYTGLFMLPQDTTWVMPTTTTNERPMQANDSEDLQPQTQTAKTKLGQQWPTMANEDQRGPAQANEGQRRPTRANERCRQPTRDNTGSVSRSGYEDR
jgi:hypothetical protein